MKRIVFLLVVVLLAVSCTFDEGSRELIGDWAEANGSYTARFSKSTLEITFSNPVLGTIRYQYTAKDGVLHLKLNGTKGTKTYHIEGNTLYLDDDVLHRL